MKEKIIISILTFSLLAVVSAWGQTQTISRKPTKPVQSLQPKKSAQLAKKVEAVPKWVTKGDYYEDLACVEDNNGKFGFIDRSGKLVIPCKWNGAGFFSQGLANVRSENGKWGYIDKSGTLVIPCKWKEVDPFEKKYRSYFDSEYHNEARVRGDDDKYYTINETGTIICRFSIKSFGLLEDDPTANTRGTAKYDQNGEVAALIKIKTTLKDFRFDGGSLGIVELEKKDGELWLYLPRRADKLKITHPSLGTLYYSYPLSIVGGRTYEMILDVGTLNN